MNFQDTKSYTNESLHGHLISICCFCHASLREFCKCSLTVIPNSSCPTNCQSPLKQVPPFTIAQARNQRKKRKSQLYFISAFFHIKITTSYLLSLHNCIPWVIPPHSVTFHVLSWWLFYPLSVECLHLYGFSTIHIWSHTSQLFLKSEERGHWSKFQTMAMEGNFETENTHSSHSFVLWVKPTCDDVWSCILSGKAVQEIKPRNLGAKTFELPGNLLIMIMCEY